MLGPHYCSPDLFSGRIPAIVSALKVHSATIADGRRSALDSTFPRTRKLLGEREFDTLAELHLKREAVLSRPLSLIGYGFPALLTGTARDLARIEWAWLESYGAPDAPAFMLGDLATLTAQAAVALRVRVHPATRIVAGLSEFAPIAFDWAVLQAGAIVVTRPELDVLLSEADTAIVDLVDFLEVPRTLGELLERDADSTSSLLRNGALAIAERVPG